MNLYVSLDQNGKEVITSLNFRSLGRMIPFDPSTIATVSLKKSAESEVDNLLSAE